MPRATLHVTIPAGVWVGDLTREFPVRIRVLSVLPTESAGVVLAELTGDRLDEALDRMRAAEALVAVDVLRRHDETAMLEFETTAAPLLEPLRAAGVPVDTPFDIEDGVATWEVTAPNDRLSALGERLRDVGLRFEVGSVRRWVDADRLLTDRQAALLETAVERGYYDTPRTCSLTELADELDLAKSTCSETLHRAEGKVIKQFLAGDG